MLIKIYFFQGTKRVADDDNRATNKVATWSHNYFSDVFEYPIETETFKTANK